MFKPILWGSEKDQVRPWQSQVQLDIVRYNQYSQVQPGGAFIDGDLTKKGVDFCNWIHDDCKDLHILKCHHFRHNPGPKFSLSSASYVHQLGQFHTFEQNISSLYVPFSAILCWQIWKLAVNDSELHLAVSLLVWSVWWAIPYQIIGSTGYDSVGLELAALLEFFLSLRWDGWQIFLGLNFICVDSISVCSVPKGGAVISAKVGPFFWSGLLLLWHFYPLADPGSRSSRPCDEYRGRGEGKIQQGFPVWWRLPPHQQTKWPAGEFPIEMQTSMAGWLSPAVLTHLGNPKLELLRHLNPCQLTNWANKAI